MSKIDEQIKELVRKKSKVELYWHIIESLSQYKDEQFQDVKDEVLAEVQAFVDAQIAIIEDGKSKITGNPNEDDVSFTVEEIKVLKQTVKKLLEPKPQKPVSTDGAYSSSTETKPTQPVKKTADNRQDKISFALANRHLANKRVKCQTPQGEVLGNVVGIDAPHIIVKTDTGHTAPIDLDNITVVH